MNELYEVGHQDQMSCAGRQNHTSAFVQFAKVSLMISKKLLCSLLAIRDHRVNGPALKDITSQTHHSMLSPQL